MKPRLVVVPTAQRLIRTASRSDSSATIFGCVVISWQMNWRRRSFWIGMPAPESAEENVRRLHLSRTDYYLYYRHSGDLIEILALWHVRRGSAPPL